MFDVAKKLVLLIVISLVALLGAVACEEAAEPEAPLAPQAAADPEAPQAPAGAGPGPAMTAADAPTPLPAQAAADPEAPKAADTGAQAVKKPITTRTGMGLDRNLHDRQVATVPGHMRTNAAPWRDGGGNREFSPWQAATLLFLNEDNTFKPFLASSWSVTDDQTTFTFKIREDAIYQDGTPVKAADLKAYWEHGGKPENIIAWGGSMLLGLRDIKGMQDLMAGDTTVAEGLVAIDDNTLEVTMESAVPTFPHVVTIDQTGFTKLEQVLADPEDWHFAPIGVGPYAMVIEKDTGYTEIIRVDLNGMSWWGEQFILDKVIYPNVPDAQVKLIMFENGEVEWVRISGPPVAEALDPNAAMHPFLYIGQSGGLWLYSLASGLAPLEDVFVRQSLIHAQDMQTTVQAVIGSYVNRAPGYVTSNVACHDPDYDGGFYDPDLARQFLAESTYGSAANLPVLRIDLGNATRINIGVITKEYWKDNLDIDLDLLKRERGMPRREGSQIIRRSSGTPVKDPIWLTNGMRSVIVDEVPGREVVDALWSYATTLPLAHPERCDAFQAVEREMIDSAYIIPHEGIDTVYFFVQPWVRGFDRPFSQEITLDKLFIQKH